MTQSGGASSCELLELPDGRVLAFAEWGPRDGVPVIHLHGIPSSRLERWPDERSLETLGVRLVTFDRPGYGRSDPMPGRTMLDVAQDIRSLADHLRLDDFALSGMSGGTPFVLAAAWAFQGRVTGAAIACGLGPLDRPGALEGMRAANVETFEVARAAPEQLAQILEGRDLVAAMPEEDGAALETMPHLAELLLESAIEATRQGWSGAVADYSAFVMPWGFDLSEIGTPFSLWHGDQDRLVPIHHSEFVASELRSAVLTTCPGQGHLAMFGHFEEMFECLTTV